MHYVICYDVTCTKRRNKVAKLLSSFGTRANKSVFELELTKSELKKLTYELKKLIEPKKDSILVYPLCKDCLVKSFSFGLIDTFKLPNPFV